MILPNTIENYKTGVRFEYGQDYRSIEEITA
jgi:hypothetical protein